MWPGTESNRRHEDFQSSALPTELPGRDHQADRQRGGPRGLNLNVRRVAQSAADKSSLTIKQAAESSGLGASIIRLAIHRRQLRAQKVGRRVLVMRNDLESFLEANPIETT